MKADFKKAEFKTEVLLDAARIRRRVAELGKTLSEDYAGLDPVFTVVMLGGSVFFADLIREVTLPVRCDMVSASSYGAGTEAANKPQIVCQPREDWSNRDVLFIEAIVDTGSTARELIDLAMQRAARSVKICTLLDKPGRRINDVRPDYAGFVIPNEFVIGFGLDYSGLGRNWPEVRKVHPPSIDAPYPGQLTPKS